jgi:hypothetical protein
VSVEIDPRLIDAALAPHPWDELNSVLYEYCAQHPRHSDPNQVLAKIVLIGRSYSAALERRKGGEPISGDFYIDHAVPAVVESELDRWLAELQEETEPTPENVHSIAVVHKDLVDLFEMVSGDNKRSLASKYLHFHRPDLFFIYDSYAAWSIRRLTKPVRRSPLVGDDVDDEYCRFFLRNLDLRESIANSTGVRLTLRQVDSLLLLFESRG